MLSQAADTNGVAAVLAATAGYRLAPLDAVNDAGAAVLVSTNGTALRISRSAAELIQACRDGHRLEDIASRFRVDVESLQAGLHTLSTRIRSLAGENRQARSFAGFLARRRLVPAQVVARIVEPLRLAFQWRIAVPCVLGAIIVLVYTYPTLARAPLTTPALWGGFATAFGLLFIHELGHGAACRAHGARVGEIGVALYLIYPAFYCDVTHAWALPRRARIVIDVGGVYFQLLTTAALATLWYATDSPVLATAVRISLGTMLLNLLPLGRFDGYWLLGDALGIVNLSSQWRTLLHSIVRRLRGERVVLPWPRWAAVAIALYSVATAYFIATVLWTLLPYVGREAWELPARLHALYGVARTADALAVLAALGHLASSAAIGWTAFALLRGLLRAMARKPT